MCLYVFMCFETNILYCLIWSMLRLIMHRLSFACMDRSIFTVGKSSFVSLFCLCNALEYLLFVLAIFKLPPVHKVNTFNLLLLVFGISSICFGNF